MTDLKLNDRIEIDWLDAYSDTDWQEYDDAVKPPAGARCKAIGYFLKQDERYIYFSSMTSTGKKGARDRHVIPNGCISKIRKLQVKRE